MSLNKPKLKTDIKGIVTDMITRESDSSDEFAERLANAIEDYVKGIQIVYTTGLTAPNGAVAGTFNHTVQ